ncbi:hypothetical protein T484DRAFT_1780570 [Baffinella frigidus]|nr:hypothetical protein T484DRAFT_1780570 [Cryptophyta sp. CCMP2293]
MQARSQGGYSTRLLLSLLLASLCGLVADTADTHASLLQRPALRMPSRHRRDASSGMPWADHQHTKDEASGGVEGKQRSKVAFLAAELRMSEQAGG